MARAETNISRNGAVQSFIARNVPIHAINYIIKQHTPASWPTLRMFLVLVSKIKLNHFTVKVRTDICVNARFQIKRLEKIGAVDVVHRPPCGWGRRDWTIRVKILRKDKTTHRPACGVRQFHFSSLRVSKLDRIYACSGLHGVIYWLLVRMRRILKKRGSRHSVNIAEFIPNSSNRSNARRCLIEHGFIVRKTGVRV